MRRGRHALILLRDRNGRYILGHKSAYPEGISRMIGGGIDPEEDPHSGAARELAEELQIHTPVESLIPLAEIIAQIQGTENEYTFITFVYLFELGDEVLTPSDDIQDIRSFSAEEMLTLIERYHTLPDTLVSRNGDPATAFRWSDYGALYGEIHRIALEEAQRLPR